MCVLERESVCVSVCVRLCVCVCVSVCVVERGRGTGVEGRGLGLRVEVESRGTGLRVGVEGRVRERIRMGSNCT